MNAPKWVPAKATNYYFHLVAWKDDVDDHTTGETIESCEECSDDEKPELILYREQTLKQIIESECLQKFWQWLQEADRRSDLSICPTWLFIDELLNAAYRAAQTQTGDNSNRLAAGTRLASIQSGIDTLNALLPQLDTRGDDQARKDTQANIESLKILAAAASDYERNAKRAGDPWIRFAFELHQTAIETFSEHPPSTCRTAELATVISGKKINRQAIERRLCNIAA